LVYFNARDLLPIIGVNIFFINDLYFIPIIHFLILISMVITVISGLLYLTPSSYESRAK
jgi:hypothetical protein